MHAHIRRQAHIVHFGLLLSMLFASLLWAYLLVLFLHRLRRLLLEQQRRRALERQQQQAAGFRQLPQQWVLDAQQRRGS
jgi:cell division protein FtsL